MSLFSTNFFFSYDSSPDGRIFKTAHQLSLLSQNDVTRKTGVLSDGQTTVITLKLGANIKANKSNS